MAEADDTAAGRVSPKEDFDPLQDDLRQRQGERILTQMEDEDADDSSDENIEDDALHSLDREHESYFTANASEMPYSITPPTSSRFMRRERRHRQGKVTGKDSKMDKQKRPAKSVISVIKDRYESNPSFSGLSSVDSDADLERENGREQRDKKRKERDEKQKTMTTTRALDRYAKRHSEDISAGMGDTTTSPLDIQTPVVPVKLEGSGRYISLASAAVKSIPISPVSSDRIERRQTCNVREECPKERYTFFKTFAALINMGSHGKKQKEQKEKERFTKRQISSDEKMWLNVIWIGLQAWQNGANPVDQENQIYLEREKIPRVLDDVMSFKVEFSTGVDVKSQDGDSLTPGELNNNRNSSCSVDTETSLADVSETYHSMCLNSEMIAQQQEALRQVQRILDRLDKCEQLFPTSRAFGQEYLQYKDMNFVRRLKSLYLWLNITRDLCQKLKLLGKVLNIQNIPGALWPDIDFESPRDVDVSRNVPLHRSSIPEIRTNSADEEEEEGDFEESEDYEEEEGEDEGEERNEEKPERDCDQSLSDRKVTFNVDSTRTSRNTSPSRDISPHNTSIGSPPDTSTPLKSTHFNTSLSRASSEASLDDLSRPSIYRNYVDKGLKKVGLSKMLVRLRDILDRSLQRAKDALEKPKTEYLHSDSVSVCKSPSEDFYAAGSSPSLDLLDKKAVPYTRSTSLTDYGAWSEEFLNIGLPSFRPTYMFLVRVLLEVIHEAMKIRLEQLENPVTEPSFLSVRQLIRECKDVLAKAVLVKQYYQHMIAAVLDDAELNNENSPMDLEQFDHDMSSMFKMYFQYLQNWLYSLQNLPEASRSLKNPLEEEWSFTKKICPHVIGGEAEAGKRFSTLAISLLNSIADFLESGIDECMSSLYDWNQQDQDENSSDEEDESEDDDGYGVRSRAKLRHSFQQTCRNFKNLFHEARERASKALGFAKLLRKDLEIAADFNIAVTTVELLKKLKETHHCRVIAPLSAGYMMFIPERIMEQRLQVLQLLNVTCGREDITVSSDPSSKDEGYLLMVRCGGGLDRKAECPLWTGNNIQVEPTAETALALAHLQVEALLLVVIHSSVLSNQRREFERLMGQTVELVNEQTSCHQVIAESLVELKESAITLRDKVATSIKDVEDRWSCDLEMEENEKNHILKLYRETMLQAYNFGFEYMKEVIRLVSGDTRNKLGHGLVLFAKDWMKFVSEKCERGRGMRPRWANQGLEFLIIACDPKTLAFLTEQEFQDLQQSMYDFISHLIGSAEKPPPWSPTHGGGLPMSRSASGDLARLPYNRFPSWPAAAAEHRIQRSTSAKSVSSEPASLQQPQSAPVSSGSHTRYKKRPSDSSLEVDLHDGDDGGIIMDVHRRSRASSSDSGSSSMFSYKPRDRTVRAIEKLERERNQRLQKHRVIGRMTGRRSEVSYHINTRKVNFRWQKANKIGEGQFGKVYSAVNMDTGELMAMKEMKFPSTEMQHYFKEIIDEIKIFEGINHRNLVKYYGVEVHRSEMLVFMEYCDRGTLEDVSRLGLPEDMIRVYTRELLIAVQMLHENGIVHRDIKGANIFLTSKGCLKLGDFGCSVKLKNHTTMAGEVNALVGTTAYMAPEVITRNDREGHGRAADIWSLGCVVIEMASGKRPWHELESNYQIMFKVGMGESPPIPESLGEEGKDFLSHCLEQRPEDRWTANLLMDHQFVKVGDIEDDS